MPEAYRSTIAMINATRGYGAMSKDFLSILDLEADDLARLLDLAAQLKADRRLGRHAPTNSTPARRLRTCSRCASTGASVMAARWRMLATATTSRHRSRRRPR